MMQRSDLPFLGGYPASTLAQVRALIARGELGAYLSRRYPERHGVRNDGALYEHAMALKQRQARVNASCKQLAKNF